MATPQYSVGMHQPATSRYKCMYEFMRPPTHFQDANGRTFVGPSPGRTTCILPKGHKGDHKNIRGETCLNQDPEAYKK